MAHCMGQCGQRPENSSSSNRPISESEIAQYSAWRHYRKIMEDGGIKKDISVAQAVKAFKVTWLYFARHKSLKEQDVV